MRSFRLLLTRLIEMVLPPRAQDHASVKQRHYMSSASAARPLLPGHADGCPWRLVSCSECGLAMPQAACQHHTQCSPFRPIDLDPVDLFESWPCWCYRCRRFLQPSDRVSVSSDPQEENGPVQAAGAGTAQTTTSARTSVDPEPTGARQGQDPSACPVRSAPLHVTCMRDLFCMGL